MRHRKPRRYRGNHRAAVDSQTRYTFVVSSALVGAGAIAFGAGSAIPESTASTASASLDGAALTGNEASTTSAGVSPGGNADQARPAVLSLEPGISRRLAEPPPERLHDWVRPADGIISSVFGLRFGGAEFHQGLDIAGPIGSPIRAAAGGRVIISGPHDGYGKLVAIEHPDGITTYYGHNSKLIAHVGEEVQAGDTIAFRGNTGNSTGPHCHFEVRENDHRINPQKWLREHGVNGI